MRLIYYNYYSLSFRSLYVYTIYIYSSFCSLYRENKYIHIRNREKEKHREKYFFDLIAVLCVRLLFARTHSLVSFSLSHAHSRDICYFVVKSQDDRIVVATLLIRRRREHLLVVYTYPKNV